MAYETIRSEKVFSGILIDVYHDVINLPDGRAAVREIVKHASAAAVLPVDSDGKLIFVRQYRHSVKAMALEIPAGILEENEDPAVGAARELTEETGNIAGKLTFIFKFYSSIGFSDECVSVYIAEGLTAASQNLDDDEFLSIEKYTPDEAFKLISDGQITDSKTTAAVLYYLAARNR